MYECRVEYHLVIRQARVIGQLRQCERVIAGHISGLALHVLARGHASDGCIQFRTPVPRIDDKRSFPCRAERLKDLIHEVRTVEVGTGEERIFARAECRYGYRESIFKKEERGRRVVR